MQCLQYSILFTSRPLMLEEIFIHLFFLAGVQVFSTSWNGDGFSAASCAPQNRTCRCHLSQEVLCSCFSLRIVNYCNDEDWGNYKGIFFVFCEIAICESAISDFRLQSVLKATNQLQNIELFTYGTVKTLNYITNIPYLWASFFQTMT